MENTKLTPPGFIQVEFSGQDIPAFLGWFRDVVTLPQFAEFRPDFERALTSTAHTFGVTVQDILDSLPPPGPALNA